MGSQRWLDWAYYTVFFGVAGFSVVTGIMGMGRWGTPSGWGLLALWIVVASTALLLRLRVDRRRNRPDAAQRRL
jgi:uncharacterized protein (DUF983 family)